MWKRVVSLAAGLLVLATMTLPAMPAGAAPLPPGQDPFYRYTGSVPLASIAPGTVLKTRTLELHVLGLALPVTVVQLLYRSTGETGHPTVNVTSVLEPPLRPATPKVISYQSFYDSLNPADEPSQAIEGGSSLGELIPNLESVLIEPALLAGYTVVVPDTEGEHADFAAGPVYGLNTLDSLRAALRSPATGLDRSAPIGLLGYSGGAIATEWAAELAPSYAPDINRLLVGAAMGGVLVDPDHNLHYVNGSQQWSGTIPMALIGVARAFHVDLTPYLSAYGRQLFRKLQKASIVQVLGAYPGLTWAQLAKPQYRQPESIPVFVHIVNQLIMSSRGTPTVPLFIVQGDNGVDQGTPGNKPGIGPGDGVMIAGDVRTLARKYCRQGVAVQYTEYSLDHDQTALPWLLTATPWLLSRFAGTPAPQDCSQIAPGNSLAPVTIKD